MAMRRYFLAAAVLVPTWAANAEPAMHHRLIRDYIAALDGGDIRMLTLAPDASFNGALLDEPILGDVAIKAFLERVTPSITALTVNRVSSAPDGGCAELRVTFSGVDRPLAEAHCLTIADGAITRIELYYDPRPLLE